MKTILVYPSDPQWSISAMHLASAIARNTHAQVGLLALVMVQNPALLGADLGDTGFDPKLAQQLESCADIAEGYGVPLTVYQMQCVTTLEALVQAVETTGAQTLFAQLPGQRVPVIRRIQGWYLRRALAAQGCTLYTLEQPAEEESLAPSVMVKPAH